MNTKLIQTKDYLLLIDEGAEIKKGGYAYQINYEKTNSQIIKIESDFQEKIANDKNGSFTKYKIIAYYPLTKYTHELDLPLLPNPFEGEGIERLALKWFVGCNKKDIIFDLGWMKIFEAGYKAAQSKQFSLEDMKKAIELARKTFPTDKLSCDRYSTEEIIQSLSTQQSPKEFIPEYEEVPNFERRMGNIQENYKYQIKTITNSEGKEEIQGTYKY